MNGCVVNPNWNVYKELKRHFKDDDSVALNTLLSTMGEDGQFSKVFQDFVKQKRKTTEDIKISEVSGRKIVNDIIQFSNLLHPDGNMTVLDYDPGYAEGYNSVSDRRFCIRIVSNEILDIANYIKYTEHSNEKLSRQQLANEVRFRFIDTLKDRVCKLKHITTEELDASYNEERFNQAIATFKSFGDGFGEITDSEAEALAMCYEYTEIAKELLGKNISESDVNLIATISEMLSVLPSNFGNEDSNNDTKSKAEKFFDTVFRDSRLNNLNKKLNDNTDNRDEYLAQQNEDTNITDEDTDDDSEDSQREETFDESFRVFDSHDGQYKTFLAHLGEEIQTYFNSLKKLNNTQYKTNEDGSKIYSYDEYNPIGIADSMSASECAMMMYTQADYTNVDRMIESVKRIAEEVPGFESFIKFYHDLSDNRDFAYQIYSAFGKLVVSKKETAIINGELVCRTINDSSNKVDALRIEYIQEFKQSAITVDESHINNIKNEVKILIGQIETRLKNGISIPGTLDIAPYNSETPEYKSDITSLVSKLTSALNSYFPSIEYSTILNYIENNKIKDSINIIDNAKVLLTYFDNIINGIKTTRVNYTTKQYESSKARAYNRQLRETDDGTTNIKNKLIDIRSIWNTGYFSKEAEAAAIQLANALVPYSMVKLELNSRNSAGKLSSDVINNSMISNLKSILESVLNDKTNPNSPLNKYKEFKFKGKQYLYSNILLEHDDIKGLFRIIGTDENGNPILEQTEYATSLLKFSLFSGVQNIDTGDSILYSGMSRGDYVATAMMHYFKGVGNDFADYFLRTPSDAPKNYLMTAPRYRFNYNKNGKTISLYTFENEGQKNKLVGDEINKIKRSSVNELEDNPALTMLNDSKSVDLDIATRILTGGTIGIMPINKKQLVTNEDKSVGYVKLEYKQDEDSVIFVVKGDVLNKDGETKLANVQLENVINNVNDKYVIYPTALNNKLKEYFTDVLLRNGIITRKLNREHPIFKAFLNTAYQEFQDAGTSIDRIFNHINGLIDLDSDTKVSERQTYEQYHHKKTEYVDSNIYDENGKLIKKGKIHEFKGIIQPLYKKVIDKVDKNNNPIEWHWEDTGFKHLSGNVFHSDRFTLYDKEGREVRNFLEELIGEGNVNDEKPFNFLYGGLNASNLHIDENGNVILTDAQKSAISNKVEEFINAYISSTIERVSEFENLLEDIPHTSDDVAEFILNYRIAYFNCNDLLEGDTKFYKNPQDFLKRAKEVQGSGVPYGLMDITRNMYNEIHVEVDNSYLNSKEMQELLKPLHNCKQFTTFRAVTIKNTVRQDENTKENLVNQLKNIFVKQGIKENVALEKAKEMMDGYKNTKVNDAQSYITFEEWIRRISARGQLYKYKPLIERILDESQPLSVEDINEFIQVQKNFYYDITYNDRMGIHAPRQIKNAEFVLVPRLIKGTELEQVYNLMIENDVDQLNTVETSKAGKSNVLTLWDNDGNITEKNLKDFKANVADATESFSYNYLYTQQETPQHVNSENKAALQIMKKILDNISPNSSLYNTKEEFMRLYSENIYDSFVSLINELNIPLDNNGNIIISDGKINGIDYTIFLDRLRDEMIRLGLDSNMMDFVTLINDAPTTRSGMGFGLNTKMPAYNNSTRTKLESVAQAVINNRITRQKLPGFHAAQITNVGWKSFGITEEKPYALIENREERITKEEYNKLSREEKDKYVDTRVTYAKELRYHPDGNNYIEVLLPPSVFGLDVNHKKYNKIKEDGEKRGLTAEEIEKLIYDDMLAEIKVKGLDKVIGYRIPTEGKQSIAVMKIVGFTSSALGSTIVVPDAWVAQTGSDFDIDSVYGINYATRIDSDGVIHKLNYLGKGKTEEQTIENKQQLFINYVLRNLSKEERNNLFKDAKLDADTYKELKEDNSEMIDYLNALDKAKKEALYGMATLYAVNNNLESYEEFNKKDFEKLNTREARCNRILDDMIKILESDESLEENLSRSNYDDIIRSRDSLMSEYVKAERDGRSCFDFFDQSDYHEDATSGLRLKARSVIRDTFCSVCNTMTPELKTSIEIVYHGDDETLKEFQKRFDKPNSDGEYERVIRGNGDEIIVKHNKFGWSADNRNVEGKLITVYSSETTAHILDAIKEGAIPNVNDFTFDVYKLFPDLGSNYDTCIGFMMQPGVTEIVNAYNRNKSIYAKDYTRPVDGAIKSIAKKLNINIDNRSIKDVIKDIEELVNSYNLSNVNILDINLLKNRINSIDENVQNLLFDYLVVKKYSELYDIASKINKLAGVCKPDKFGAKQTIYQTRQIFEDIADILKDDNPVFKGDFLGRIYPGISEIIQTDGTINIDNYITYSNNNSVYPSLHYFLKYASATSIKVNETLFITQHPEFIKAVKQIKSVMSGENPKLTEKTYNDFERYIVSHLYRQTPLLVNPVTYIDGIGIKTEQGNISEEINRIFGYNHAPDLKVDYNVPKVDENGNEVKDEKGNTVYITKRKSFTVSDINNPTKEDIDAFAKLTPAQKVLFIKQNFKDGLVCKYINTSLVNGANRGTDKFGAQTLEFIEDGVDREEVYEEFRKTYMNSNPLLVLTATDIIKYAYIVEGYQLKRTAVNKVIDNDILTNSKGLYGTGLINELDDKIKHFVGNISLQNVDELCENFVRSHSTMKEISHTYINPKDAKKYLGRHSYGIITLENNNATNDFLISHGFGYTTYEETINPDGNPGQQRVFNPNHYIEINYGKNNRVLYKITVPSNPNATVIWLTPLNKLQTNESDLWSANDANNAYKSSDFYKEILDEKEQSYPLTDLKSVMDAARERADKKEFNKPERTTYATVKENIPITNKDRQSGWYKALVDEVNKHFDGLEGGTMYTEISALNNHIKVEGINNGEIEYINETPYVVYKLNMKAIIPYFKNVTKPIPPELSPVRELINRVRERGIAAGHEGKAYTQIFAIDKINFNEPVNTESRNSDIIEDITNIDKAIRRESRNNINPEADKYVHQADNRNSDPTVASTKEHLDDVIISQAEALDATVRRLFGDKQNNEDPQPHSINFFETDKDTGELMSMTDPKVIAMLKSQPSVRRAYLRNILQANKLINMFQAYKHFNYSPETEHLRHYVDKIVENVEKLEKSSVLKDAEELYVTEYLAKISGNPKIQKNIISLLDGWHETWNFGSYINDIQDSSNPLVQIITSDVTRDISAKELQGKQRRAEFKKYIKELKAEAASKGLSINWDNLVDENGKWIEEYTNQLAEDYDKLYQDKELAYSAYKDYKGSKYEKAQLYEKYLKARLAYNKWRAKNINQEIDDDYYYQYNALEEDVINKSTGKFYDIYVEYKMLTDELRDISSHSVNGDLDEHWENEKKRVLREMRNLLSNSHMVGDMLELKEDLEEYQYSKDPEKRRQQIIDSMSSYNILSNYVAKKRLLDEEYFEYTENFGFKEQLKNYQSVIRHYEGRGIPEIELMKIEKYKEAKNWIRKNAYLHYNVFDPTKSKKELTKEDTEILLNIYGKEIDLDSEEYPRQVQAALNYFRTGAGSRNNKDSIYKQMSKDIKDDTGIVDARKLTSKQIQAIKDEQRRRYGYGEDSLYSERGIIHNSSDDTEVYTQSFYEGMKIDGMTNPKYLGIVNGVYDSNGNLTSYGLNHYLSRCFRDGILHTSELSQDELEAILDLLKKLGYNSKEQTFDTKQGVKKHVGVTKANVQKISDFIKNNVDFTLSEKDKRRFDIEKANAELKGTGYFISWCRVNMEWSEEKGKFIPNHLFWGHAKPKDSVKDKFTDKTKTAALRIMNSVFDEHTTKYYDMQKDMIAETFGVNSPEYKKWIEDNHIYNPYKHEYTPLVCWTISEPNDHMPGTWEPTYKMKSRQVKKDHKNSNYKSNVGTLANYKRKEERNKLIKEHDERLDNLVDSEMRVNHSYKKDCIPDGTYDRPLHINEYEQKLKDYVQNMLAQLCRTKSAKNYIDHGYLPTKAKKESEEFSKTFLKELFKGFGYVENVNGESFWDPNLSYDRDYVPNMPMLHQLRSKETEVKPSRFDYPDTIEGEKQYNKALEDYNKRENDIKEKNKEIHRNLIDRNWENVLEEFILQAAHYNAIQDNKYQLYFGQKLLNDTLVYTTKSPRFWKTPQLKRITSDESSENVYEKVKDENLIRQYNEWLHRIIFNQFKEDPSSRRAHFMNVLQSITSYNYMTLNIRGGVANVTVGESNIFGEIFANQYFGKHWLQAGGIYTTGIGSYFLNMYDDYSTTKADAIIKGMHIVDYDEHQGVVVPATNMAEWNKRLRDLGFTPLSMGEHYMQNRAMFAMMLSHRLVANPKYGKEGQPKYVLMNLSEFQASSRELALMEILNDKEKEQYNQFIENTKKSKGDLKDYVWERRDFISDFLIQLPKEKIDEFTNKVKTIKEEKEKEFNEAPDLFSQLELAENGQMGIVAGSRLAELNTMSFGKDIAKLDNVEITDAFTMLGMFRNRVISVNKKIHGNYGKLDAAQIESKWWGGLVMQYHKHIVPGILKRYRVKGYYNEEKGTIEKGCRIALYDWLTAPIDQIAKANHMSDGERDNLKGIQNITTFIHDYFQYLRLNWKVMSDSEKQNILRNLGDFCGIACGILLALLLRLGWDDDDDNFVYNFGLYQADRLASEVFMWNPYGAFNEAKKLWSNPIAVESIINDGFNIIGTIGGIILEGEDFDPYYHTGRFAGRHKLGVYVERRIPYWRNWVTLRDIAQNNSYYKVGANPIGLINVEKITNNIKD